MTSMASRVKFGYKAERYIANLWHGRLLAYHDAFDVECGDIMFEVKAATLRKRGENGKYPKIRISYASMYYKQQLQTNKLKVVAVVIRRDGKIIEDRYKLIRSDYEQLNFRISNTSSRDEFINFLELWRKQEA